jgi:hypothetical protein
MLKIPTPKISLLNICKMSHHVVICLQDVFVFWASNDKMYVKFAVAILLVDKTFKNLIFLLKN